MKECLLVLAALLLATTPLRAQERPRPLLPEGTAVGGSAGAFLLEGKRIYTVSVNATDLRSGGLGVDFALSLPPEVLQYGAVALAADLAPAYNKALPGVTFLVKLGTSVVFVAGSGGANGLVGLCGGLGGVIQIGPRAGLRIDLVERAYVVDRSLLSIPSISIGLTSLPGGS